MTIGDCDDGEADAAKAANGEKEKETAIAWPTRRWQSPSMPRIGLRIWRPNATAFSSNAISIFPANTTNRNKETKGKMWVALRFLFALFLPGVCAYFLPRGRVTVSLDIYIYTFFIPSPESEIN